MKAIDAAKALSVSQPYRIKTATLNINVRVEGSGPPLLFLGGSNFDLSLKALVFDSQLPQHFTVAAADPRGLGATDAPAGDWTMKDYAQDALALLDALEWDNAFVLGESFGAMTALHLAALAPERITRLALAAASPGGVGGSSYPVQEFLDINDPEQRAISALSIIDNRWSSKPNYDAEQAQQDIAARVEAEALFIASHNNATGYPRLLQARAGHDISHALPGITCDTLVFAGRYDQQAPIDRAEYITSHLPNSQLHVIDGGHSHCFATPEPVTIMIRKWCATHAQPASL